MRRFHGTESGIVITGPWGEGWPYLVIGKHRGAIYYKFAQHSVCSKRPFIQYRYSDRGIEFRRGYIAPFAVVELETDTQVAETEEEFDRAVAALDRLLRRYGTSLGDPVEYGLEGEDLEWVISEKLQDWAMELGAHDPWEVDPFRPYESFTRLGRFLWWPEKRAEHETHIIVSLEPYKGTKEVLFDSVVADDVLPSLFIRWEYLVLCWYDSVWYPLGEAPRGDMDEGLLVPIPEEILELFSSTSTRPVPGGLES